MEDCTGLTHYPAQYDSSIICMLGCIEFLIQDGVLEMFLHYTREWSHVPGCVSHSLPQCSADAPSLYLHHAASFP